MVVAVVLVVALSGCVGWSADSPAGGGVSEGENGPAGPADGTNGESGDGGQEPADDEDTTAEGDDSPNPGSADEEESSADGTEPDGNESDPTDAENNVTTETDANDDGDSDNEIDGDEADGSTQEYDAQQFTFVYIAYEDDEERPPSSVELLNTHERSIDLSGWAVTTTEGGEYVFPEDTVIESDSTRAVRFEPGELTRDGGTLALIDAQGNVVIEDEYEG